jgi:hypothetical protein
VSNYTRELRASSAIAEDALETLREQRKHAATCRQCQLDSKLCKTAGQYRANFEVLFSEWQRARRNGA